MTYCQWSLQLWGLTDVFCKFGHSQKFICGQLSLCFHFFQMFPIFFSIYLSFFFSTLKDKIERKHVITSFNPLSCLYFLLLSHSWRNLLAIFFCEGKKRVEDKRVKKNCEILTVLLENMRWWIKRLVSNLKRKTSGSNWKGCRKRMN